MLNSKEANPYRMYDDLPFEMGDMPAIRKLQLISPPEPEEEPSLIKKIIEENFNTHMTKVDRHIAALGIFATGIALIQGGAAPIAESLGIIPHPLGQAIVQEVGPDYHDPLQGMIKDSGDTHQSSDDSQHHESNTGSSPMELPERFDFTDFGIRLDEKPEPLDPAHLPHLDPQEAKVLVSREREAA